MAVSAPIESAIQCGNERPNATTKASTAPRPASLTIPITDVPNPSPSPPLEGSGEEDNLYGEDDAQSFIQPAMSPIATRLTSPKTPAAEKVAAMDQVMAGYFDGEHGIKEEESSGEETPNQYDSPLIGPMEEANGQLPSTISIPPSEPAPEPEPQTEPAERSPTPCRTGPKEMVVTPSQTPLHKSAMTGVLANSSHRRSTSGGAEALRRLSRALPSLSLPSNLLSNRLSTPSFFSSSTTTPPKTSPTITSPLASTNHASTFPTTSHPKPPPAQRHSTVGDGGHLAARPQSAVSRKSPALRRSTSDESMLYHSLSRMSSFGDDKRFTHVREQVNSRFKAIVDSFDPPSFKLPTIPSTLSLRSPLKKTEFSIEDISKHPSNTSLLRTPKSPKDPLDSILETLTGDLVIMGGYRGSVLRSAEPPHRQLWVPIKVGLNVRKVNLEIGLNPEDEERMGESIIPSGMLKNIGPIDISKKLFKRIRECENARSGKLRIHDYGYDWRLSPHILSKGLIDFLKTLPSNQGENPTGALVVAHSLGGMITRHAVNQAPELFSGVVYAGAPQRCVNILGPLRNGDAVLLNEKVLTAHVNFTLRTTFVFLPEDGFCFVDKVTNEEYPIDFFNAEDWVKYRLCPSVSDAALPPFLAKRIGSLGSFLNLPESLSLSRGRSTSDPAARRPGQSPPRNKITKDRPLASQVDNSLAAVPNRDQRQQQHQKSTRSASPRQRTRIETARERNLVYLTRTLAEIKRFRAESQHMPSHQSANAYPPIAVIYGKEIPTVYACRVTSREAIACSDAYDDLVFRSGDGVVLAREAMPPPGYEIAKGGRISTDKGHISILGDLNAVGRALGSVVKGRGKGIGLRGETAKE